MFDFLLLIVTLLFYPHNSTTRHAPKCGPDEVFAKYCSGGDSGITKCSEYLDFPTEITCTQGCICSGSKLRDAKGKCIESNDCPELFRCTDDRNAEPSCGRFCNSRCPNHPGDEDNCNSAKGCDKDGCECVPPYLYDTQIRKCVKPEACSEICGPDEVFSNDCIGAGCTATQCYERDRLPGCIDVVGSYCVRGCVCAGGKLRAQNGTCLTPDQCPPKSEENCRYPYSRPGCGSNCDRRCNSGAEQCNEQCVANGCDCIPPFVYDEVSGSCMPPDQCKDAQ